MIRLWAIGAQPPELVDDVRLADARSFEASDFVVHHDDTDAGLLARLAAIRPHVILTFGRVGDYVELSAAPLDVRRRWLHIDDIRSALPHLAERVMTTMVENATRQRFPERPLVSVFTPTYRTGDGVSRLHESLLAQTYLEWEWVVYDDSDDGGATFAILADLAETDSRVKPFRSSRRSGSIGEVKRRACGLCTGQLVVELDHDDRLLHGASNESCRPQPPFRRPVSSTPTAPRWGTTANPSPTATAGVLASARTGVRSWRVASCSCRTTRP